MIINPGHFHAGLVLREMHPELSEDVYIYGEAGADLDNFMKLIRSFNEREKNPTRWNFHIRTGSDYLQQALDEKKGTLAVLAGRNDRKIYDIEALHNAGIPVLSDKPLTVDGDGVKVLEKILASGGAPLMDMMTEREEITTRLQDFFFRCKEIFGEIDCSGEKPAIEKESVHHLCKIVNGNPLIRPAWYFDVKCQGEGIVDVTTHQADIVQRLICGEQAPDFLRDVQILEAKAWDTIVPAEKFAECTRTPAFPESLADRVQDGALALRCNGEFTYRMRGVPVRLSVIWALQAAPGGGDTFYSCVRGTGAALVVDQGPATGGRPELWLEPAAGQDLNELAAKVSAALSASSEFSGVTAEISGDKVMIRIPDALRYSHEMHFAMVLNGFLEMLSSGKEPEGARSALFTKYATLAAARDFSNRQK